MPAPYIPMCPVPPQRKMAQSAEATAATDVCSRAARASRGRPAPATAREHSQTRPSSAFGWRRREEHGEAERVALHHDVVQPQRLQAPRAPPGVRRQPKHREAARERAGERRARVGALVGLGRQTWRRMKSPAAICAWLECAFICRLRKCPSRAGSHELVSRPVTSGPTPILPQKGGPQSRPCPVERAEAEHRQKQPAPAQAAEPSAARGKPSAPSSPHSVPRPTTRAPPHLPRAWPRAVPCARRASFVSPSASSIARAPMALIIAQRTMRTRRSMRTGRSMRKRPPLPHRQHGQHGGSRRGEFEATCVILSILRLVGPAGGARRRAP